ncbi:hypothetical protein Tco_0115882 [Tanacetum coccineum]
MACALPHTDSEVEALVQRLINEDKGRQDVLLNLAFQFEDSCAVRDDLRKAYEKCNDISQESRALICTLLKESSEKDRKLHLSICPLTEKELHQLRMDEEALKEMLEEEAMNKKAQEEKIRQEQAENDAFFLEFGVVRMSYLVPLIAVVFVAVVGCYLASVPQEEDHQYLLSIYRVIGNLHCGDWRGSFLEKVAFTSRHAESLPSVSAIPYLNIAISFLGSAMESCNSEDQETLCPRVFGMKVSISTSRKVMASGKNDDDGDLLLFQDGPDACDISAGTLRLFISWEFSRPVAGVKVSSSSGTLLEVRAISRSKVAEGVKDYLDLKGASEITRMFPSRRSKDGFSDFNLQDLSSTYESYIAYKGQNKVSSQSIYTAC